MDDGGVSGGGGLVSQEQYANLLALATFRKTDLN